MLKYLTSAPIFVSNICPIECEHCAYSCTKKGIWTPEKIIKKFCFELSRSKLLKIRFIDITGGEPILNLSRLGSIIDITHKYFEHDQIVITSSGFWAYTKNSTKNVLGFLKKKHIYRLNVSTDRFHLKKVSLANVENILSLSKEFGIHVTLKPLLDSQSNYFREQLMRIALKYHPELIFCNLEPMGRARKFDIKIMKSIELTHQFMQELESKTQKKRNYPYFPKSILTTLVPNGDVFICATTNKLTKMGNIQNNHIDEMIQNLKKTFLCNIIANRGCNYLLNFLSKKDDRCDICRNYPLNENFKFSKEENGRRFLIINEKTDFDNLLNNIKTEERELLISIQFPRSFIESNKSKIEYIDKLTKIFDKIKINKYRFILSRPIPRCAKSDLIIKGDQSTPTNCFDCRELFTIKNGYVRLCPFVYDFLGPKFKELKNRQQIYQYFKKEHDKLQLPEKCKSCLYRMRNNCNGMCFAKKISKKL